MNGSQLARTLADIISRKPELDADFQELVAKWVKSSLLKAPTLQGIGEIRAVTSDEFVIWYLKRQPDKDVPALAKKLDPHLPDLKNRHATDLRSHLAALIAGKVQPTPKAASGKGSKGKAKAAARPIEEVLRLTNPLQRRIELEKLAPADLRAGINKHAINAGSLSSQPSKTEMVEHIQAAIAAGWPATRSVLDDSKY